MLRIVNELVKRNCFMIGKR